MCSLYLKEFITGDKVLSKTACCSDKTMFNGIQCVLETICVIEENIFLHLVPLETYFSTINS